MMGLLDALARPLMGLMEAEKAHRFAVNALKWAPLRRPGDDDALLAIRAFGLNFSNPVGMAAGFDKHGEVPDALLRLGFGFVDQAASCLRPRHRPKGGHRRPAPVRLAGPRAAERERDCRVR